MADLIAYIDGGSRGKPGPAGIGVILEYPGGEREEISRWIGPGDNNYAEYAALLVALQFAAEKACRRLRVFSDSEVVVRQITGHYSCRNPLLREIHSLCIALIASFEQFTITHIPREDNRHADRLANAAIDRVRRRGEHRRRLRYVPHIHKRVFAT
jgi:ribonuclease HI